MKIIGKQKQHKRSTTEIKENKKIMNITISYTDIPSLRASINAITRDINTIESTITALTK